MLKVWIVNKNDTSDLSIHYYLHNDINLVEDIYDNTQYAIYKHKIVKGVDAINSILDSRNT